MEIWKDVVGYEGIYSVSNLGRIRRDAPANGATVGKILPLGEDKNGYKNRGFCVKNVRRTIVVHKVVARAFIGERKTGQQINHIDGNKTNNCATNLEYVTQSENAKHAFRLGLSRPTYGDMNGRSKSTKEEIVEIRRLYAIGHRQKELREMFNLSTCQIHRIVHRKRWPHV